MALHELKHIAARREYAGNRLRPLRRLASLGAALLLAALMIGLSPANAQALSAGSLTLSPGKGSLATLSSSQLDSVTAVDIKVPASLPFYGAVQLRSASNGAGYRAKLGISADGQLRVSISRVSGGKETALGTSQSTGTTVKAGETVRLQGAVAGSNPVQVYARAWKSGATTPNWHLAARDYTSSRITTAAATRLWGYLSPSAPSSATVAFSNATTASASLTVVSSYPVSTWVNVGSASEPAPSPAPAPTTDPAPALTTSGKPSSTTTGVKAGSTLTRHDGDITVTKDGTVLSNLDIHGFATVRAKNVTISNSIVRGGKAKGYPIGLITNYGYAGLLIENVRIVPAYPSVEFDGIKGSDFTARRVHISGGVDSVKIQGNNVTIADSLLENTNYFASDPQQGGGPTHNDNVQILKGTNLRITGSTIRGATNFAVLGAASQGNTGLYLSGNWLDGGHCTVKLQLSGSYTQTSTVTNNKFGPNRKVSTCPFTAYPAVKLTQSGNTMEETGAIVKPLIVVS